MSACAPRAARPSEQRLQTVRCSQSQEARTLQRQVSAAHGPAHTYLLVDADG
eukprot:SAG11_NODE_12333_length_708_cov_1.763547_1_plen_51_part_10